MDSQVRDVDYLADEMRELCELMARQRSQCVELCEESKRIRAESRWIRQVCQLESALVDESEFDRSLTV